MARKRKASVRQRTQASPPLRKEAGGTFAFGWLVVVFFLGLGLGAIAGYQAALVFQSGSAAAGTALTDAYGRSPGHPHYRHDHP